VSRRRSVEALAGLLLLLLALAAALLSRGVADAASSFRQEQAAWEQGLAPHAPAARGTAERIGEWVLDIRARTRVQAAYVDYRQRLWFESANTLFRQIEARADAIERMKSLRGSLGSSADRSRLDVALCVLSALNASASGNQKQMLLGSAVGFCRDATLEDPTNAEAKYDLELLLDQAQKAQDAQGHSRSGGSKSKRRQDQKAATPHTQRERRVGY
jgi:hypothetical protein